MSRRAKQERRGRREADRSPAARRSSRGRVLAALAVIAIAAVAGFVVWKPAPAAGPGPAASAAPATASAPPDMAPLVGNWLRPDGGYVLSVASVDTGGAVAASYFNPQPIRVARAEARREDGHVGLFVQFDHPNYPGSTYTLAYDPATDTLVGIYYQALQKASYDVRFVRQR
jgi:hypothetical protein